VDWNESELFEGTVKLQNYAARLVLDVPRRMIPNDIRNLALLVCFKVQVKQDRHTLFTCSNDL